jgi:hypothetical protein
LATSQLVMEAVDCPASEGTVLHRSRTGILVGTDAARALLRRDGEAMLGEAIEATCDARS